MADMKKPATGPTTVLAALKAARRLLSKPERWTKGWFAKDKDGADVSELSKHATCFCPEGAIYRSAPGLLETDALAALERGLPKQWYSVPLWNDAPRRTHAQVLRLFDRAIEAERKRVTPCSE